MQHFWGTANMSVRCSSLQFSELAPELVTIVAEQLDTRSLPSFAAASAACLAAAKNELRVRLPGAVQHCLLPGRSCRGMDALVKAPGFRLPDDLVAIPAGAFMHCTSLTQLTLPATVKAIGNGAFWGCTMLTKLTLSTALATIGDRAFNHCPSLTEFTLPVDGFTQAPTWHGVPDRCGSDGCWSRCPRSSNDLSLPLRERVFCTACMSQSLARSRSRLVALGLSVGEGSQDDPVDLCD